MEEVVYPISIRFEDGGVEQYDDVEALETDLEDFDSDADTNCEARDKLGRLVRLKVDMLELKELSLQS
jgi:hypothetical protein